MPSAVGAGRRSGHRPPFWVGQPAARGRQKRGGGQGRARGRPSARIGVKHLDPVTAFHAAIHEPRGAPSNMGYGLPPKKIFAYLTERAVTMTVVAARPPPRGPSGRRQLTARGRPSTDGQTATRVLGQPVRRATPRTRQAAPRSVASKCGGFSGRLKKPTRSLVSMLNGDLSANQSDPPLTA